MAGYYGITLAIRVCVRPSVRPSVGRQSVFLCPDDNMSKCQWIFTKLSVCIDIVDIWFGVIMGKFCQFLTKLSAHHMSEFSFKAKATIVCLFTRHTIVAGYYGITLAIRVSVHQSVRSSDVRPSVFLCYLSKCQWIFTKLGVCIDIVKF